MNTKYELTAANTSKLWSKFESELLGRTDLGLSQNDISRDKPYGANELFD